MLGLTLVLPLLTPLAILYLGILGGLLPDLDTKLAAVCAAALGALASTLVLIAWVHFARPTRVLADRIQRIADVHAMDGDGDGDGHGGGGSATGNPGGNDPVRVSETGAGLLSPVVRAINRLTDALRRRRAEVDRACAERIELERKLYRSQATLAATQIVDTMAHEIGSPLNTILGRARLSASDPACPDDVRATLETIASQSERIARVVGEMLNVLRRPRLPTGRCDLVVVAERAVSFIAPAYLRHPVPVRLERDAPSAYVDMDEERALQIVINACMNAIDAQTDENEVTIRIRGGKPKPSGTREVVLEVEDRGPAIEPALSEPDAPLVGADIPRFGLMIARGLVIEAGGLFELHPGPHGGTVRRITLPGGGAAAPFMEAKYD
jgi:signal transduction histidine kinase